MLDDPHAVERPYIYKDLADDLVLSHAADDRTSAVYRGCPVVSHDEPQSVRHLVGKLQVAGLKAQFLDIGLVDSLTIDLDIAVFVHVEPVSCAADDALYEDSVVIVEGNDVACLKRGTLQGYDDLSFFQGRRHGVAVDL